MTLRLSILLLTTCLLAACQDATPSASQTPNPQSETARFPSLAASMPSPLPSVVLPPMPPELAGSFVFYEDFEQGIAKWDTGTTKTEQGWHLLQANTCGGLYTMLLGVAEHKPFTPTAKTVYLQPKAPIPLPKNSRAQLQYDVKGVANPFEAMSIQPEIRFDGKNWQAIGVLMQGFLPIVRTFTVDLTPFAGKTIELRFKGTITANAEPQTGFYLDDIQIVEPRDSVRP
jgi:hypothetical protein